MKFDFIACPLRVYRNKVFVEPGDVSEALTGAVVEVFFTMRHYHLRDKKFDTFQGDQDSQTGRFDCDFQIKRCNAREGPWDVIKNLIDNWEGYRGREGRERMRSDGAK